MNTNPWRNEHAAERLGAEADKLREQARNLDVVKMKLATWLVGADVEMGHAAFDAVDGVIASITDAMSDLNAAITALDEDAGALESTYAPKRSIGGGV